MENKEQGIPIPEQEGGAKSDTKHEVTLDTPAEAQAFFQTATRRLQDINRWHEFAGAATADFQLTDASGNPVTRTPQVGDCFKISIPAPKNESGDGFDWVQIEDIQNEANPAASAEFFMIRVRPCSNPGNSPSEAAHFFDEQATSTFLVRRDGNTVSAEVHGRNEHANTATEGFVDKVRNTVVAMGAKLGLSTPQWKSLVKGILKS